MSFYQYKGYLGSAEVDVASGVLVGKLLFIRDSIAYSADSGKHLEVAFREAVDEYLATCAEHGDDPDVPCKGSFNVRIDPDLHRRSAFVARARGITLNQFVGQALENACRDSAGQQSGLAAQVDHRAAPLHAAAAVLMTHSGSHGIQMLPTNYIVTVGQAINAGTSYDLELLHEWAGFHPSLGLPGVAPVMSDATPSLVVDHVFTSQSFGLPRQVTASKSGASQHVASVAWRSVENAGHIQ